MDQVRLMSSANLVLTYILLLALVARQLSFKVDCSGLYKVNLHENNDNPRPTRPERAKEAKISLDNMEDLNHLSNLLLRNYNITDESLLQLSWLMNLSTAPGSYKQYLKPRAHESSGSPDSIKSRLALELELFISHLRNRHLRRISNEDLESLVQAANLSNSLSILQRRHYESGWASKTKAINRAENDFDESLAGGVKQGIPDEARGFSSSSLTITEGERRCDYLVTLYKSELLDNQVKQQQQEMGVSNLQPEQQQQQQQQQAGDGSKIDSAPISRASNSSELSSMQGQERASNSSDLARADDATRIEKSSMARSSEPGKLNIDDERLLRLCKLAVDCQSADDMVQLISMPWNLNKDQVEAESDMTREIIGVGGGNLDGDTSTAGNKIIQTQAIASIGDRGNQHAKRDSLIRKARIPDDLAETIDRAAAAESSISDRSKPELTHKSLRDSLSMSLSKLCPLMLFQIHEDDEQCSFRRDDTPSIIAVWGFATLFVTIVCFCSLIGLSITPFIGQSPAAVLSNHGSETKSTVISGAKKLSDSERASPQQAQMHPNQEHKATLTIFEGLAVGSLVGSALFSLIPQAFELQERESNQSFLTKAFIIFSGIYLFFCSERIMRIILDTRQRSKRNKRLMNRSSTTAAIEQHDSALVSKVSASYTTMGGQVKSKLAQHESIYTADNCLTQDEKKYDASGLRLAEQEVPQHNNSRSRERKYKVHKVYRDRTFRSRRQRKRSVTNRILPNQRSARASSRRLTGSQGRMKPSDRASFAGSDSSIASYSLMQSRDSLYYLTQRLQKSRGEGCRDSNSSWASVSSKTRSFDSYELVDDERHHNDIWPDPYDEKITINPLVPSSIDEAMKYSSSSSSSTSQSYDDDDTHMFKKQSQPGLNLADMNQVYRHRLESLNSTQSPATMDLADTNDYADLQYQTTRREISTVAWMIILGDGLHNFIDGISIGAAFSESILSGVSISVAVICEEFPHELGDFAVLVSSGMTVRQALGYNFLSACTCYLGMAVGIILGDVTDGASYISALAAGVFLYIALVDMMGELSAALEESSRYSITRTLKLLLLQNVGIFIGISIIFVLSFIDF